MRKINWEYCECGCKCHTALEEGKTFSIFNDLKGTFYLYRNMSWGDRTPLGKHESFDAASTALEEHLNQF